MRQFYSFKRIVSEENKQIILRMELSAITPEITLHSTWYSTWLRELVNESATVERQLLDQISSLKLFCFT